MRRIIVRFMNMELDTVDIHEMYKIISVEIQGDKKWSNS